MLLFISHNRGLSDTTKQHKEGASVQFGQHAGFQAVFFRFLATTNHRLFSKRPWILHSLVFLIFVLGVSAYGAEPRRCLRDGQVVITNVPCELLGNATELNPPPDKHFKRGEPAPRNLSQPAPVKSDPAKSILPPQTAHQIADSAIQQMVSTLITNLLLPVALISALVVWLKRRARLAAERLRRQPFAANSTDSQAKHHAIQRRSAHTNVEPFIRDTSAAVSETPQPAAWSLELIRDLEWKRFEDVCQQFYEMKGIRSETTALGPDGGIDIRLYKDDSAEATSIVQCKAWGERVVGVKPVRELLGVMTHEKIGKALFMTSGSYSEEAKIVADANRITLIDGNMLLMMIQRLPADRCDALLAFATAGDYKTPTCPNCGAKMKVVAGTGGRPDFWGCQKYPHCRQKLGKRR